MGWNDVDKWSNLGGSNLGVTRYILSLRLPLSFLHLTLVCLCQKNLSLCILMLLASKITFSFPTLGFPRQGTQADSGF